MSRYIIDSIKMDVMSYVKKVAICAERKVHSSTYCDSYKDSSKYKMYKVMEEVLNDDFKTDIKDKLPNLTADEFQQLVYEIENDSKEWIIGGSNND